MVPTDILFLRADEEGLQKLKLWRCKKGRDFDERVGQGH
jgi:hypothetical protein